MAFNRTSADGWCANIDECRRIRCGWCNSTLPIHLISRLIYCRTSRCGCAEFIVLVIECVDLIFDGIDIWGLGLLVSAVRGWYVWGSVSTGLVKWVAAKPRLTRKFATVCSHGSEKWCGIAWNYGAPWHYTQFLTIFPWRTAKTFRVSRDMPATRFTQACCNDSFAWVPYLLQ